MNKRQWKKFQQKRRLKREALEKSLGIDKWKSNIVFQTIAKQITNRVIYDCGIKIRREPMLQHKIRRLGDN